MTLTVFLADDHAVIRDGLGLLLETNGDMRVVGTAENGRQAVQQVKHLRPDIVVMDIAMPELNGIEAAVRIMKRVRKPELSFCPCMPAKSTSTGHCRPG